MIAVAELSGIAHANILRLDICREEGEQSCGQQPAISQTISERTSSRLNQPYLSRAWLVGERAARYLCASAL